jgi:hypothetical protein
LDSRLTGAPAAVAPQVEGASGEQLVDDVARFHGFGVADVLLFGLVPVRGSRPVEAFEHWFQAGHCCPFHRHARVGQPVDGFPAGAVEQHDRLDRNRVEGGVSGPGGLRVRGLDVEDVELAAGDQLLVGRPLPGRSRGEPVEQLGDGERVA